jgi:glycine/D-amino acid oxidase-like deaminating enzyme
MVTRKRDLRTGRPLWLDSARIRVTCRARVPRRADTVIVGAGISGAALAYMLRERGEDVLVVDRREPLHGSTAASTAFLLYEIDMPLFDLARKIGRGRAERAWRRSVKAVGDLREIVASERIGCGWRDVKSIYLAGNAYGSRALRWEAGARKAAGIGGAFLSGGELRDRFGMERTGAILSGGSAQVNPMQLAAGLLKCAMREGVRLCSPVAIKGVAADSSGVILTTGDDQEIEARHVVFCTGYEVMKAVPAKGHQIKSTWALASEPSATAPDWLKEHILWEASDPYLYVRLMPDGRLIAGGEDEPYSRDHQDRKLLVEKTDTIARKVKALVPGLKFTIAYRWGGAFGVTATGLPSIGAVPGYPNCYAVMGFGGNGITYAMIAAKVVSLAIAGRNDPDADLYRLRLHPKPHVKVEA